MNSLNNNCDTCVSYEGQGPAHTPFTKGHRSHCSCSSCWWCKSHSNTPSRCLKMSALTGKVITNKIRKEVKMTYTITLETFNGSVKKISVPSKGAVSQFINEYPKALPVGISVKMSCDALGVRGTLRGVAKW